MCNGSHSENGSALHKKPLIASYPAGNLIVFKKGNITGNLNHFPLFHGTSGERITEGNISCPSCHNVHQGYLNEEKERE